MDDHKHKEVDDHKDKEVDDHKHKEVDDDKDKEVIRKHKVDDHNIEGSGWLDQNKNTNIIRKRFYLL